jgi:hydrogenase maturation protease
MITVIGCGNANRKDDAAGIEVIRLLRRRQDLRGRDDVQLLDAGTDGMHVMFSARGSDALIVVDGAQTGSELGALFEVPGHELEVPHVPTLNLHDFRWDHALYAGRQIFRDEFPADVTVFLIEVLDTQLGIGLSPEIVVAVNKAADCIAAHIASRLVAVRAGVSS